MVGPIEQRLHYCVYYDNASQAIVDFFPADVPAEVKARILASWQQDIARKILIALAAAESLTMQELKKQIGHSNSTLHENILKLEEDGLLETQIIYEGNKIRTLRPKILFITRNPESKSRLQRFFQGMWVNSGKSKAVITFLQDNPDKFFSADQIAAKTNIPVDEVEIILSNWDSQFTRALSDFLKETPFEKKVLYRGTP